ncbi:MAG: hypothetical protein K2Y23_19125 [Cyanobacteria bacterium]|nr:hypothetical protein [Cyanobacteriota bacterium]
MVVDRRRRRRRRARVRRPPAIGSRPSDLLTGILREGAVIAVVGIIAGGVFGYTLFAVASSDVANVQLPGAVPATIAAILLGVAAVTASLMPAARAARVDVLSALRSE